MKKNFFINLFAFFVPFGCCTASISGNIRAIDTTETVRIADSNQVIRIKGNNDKNPVLLFLNGGPGDSVLSQMDKMFNELQKDFTVVLWDQRNVGKTAKLNDQQAQPTQELLKRDTLQLITYLIQKFGKKKIVLVAHSYGTTLGFYIANKHSDLLHAFVATNPLVHQIESERITLKMLKNHAEENKNTKAINELSKVGIPFKDGEELYYARKWLFDFEGKGFARKKSFKKSVLSWASTWLNLFNEACLENQFLSTKKIECPVFFIIGKNDHQTNAQLAQRYYNVLKAPQKDIHTIENAGHLIPFENGAVFQKSIRQNMAALLEKEKY